MNKVENISSLAKVKLEYRQLLDILRNKVETKFGNEFLAYYLLGSVGWGDDISGISDLDTEIIIKREVTDE